MSQNTPIGEKIKSLRTSKNLTLKQLSEMTGLSTGFLSQMERGMSSIAIDTLEKIAEVLNVSLSGFFEGTDTFGDPIVHSFDQKNTQISPEIIQSVLSHDIMAFDILPMLFHLMPFANANEETLEMYTHNGEEFIYVLEGIVTVFLGDNRYTLYPGDSVLIHSNERHNWMNCTNKAAKLLTVNVPNPFKDKRKIDSK